VWRGFFAEYQRVGRKPNSALQPTWPVRRQVPRKKHLRAFCRVWATRLNARSVSCRGEASLGPPGARIPGHAVKIQTRFGRLVEDVLLQELKTAGVSAQDVEVVESQTNT